MLGREEIRLAVRSGRQSHGVGRRRARPAREGDRVTVELRRSLATVWTKPEVARVYRYRPEYPSAVFDILRRLIIAPRTVLDAGCGTGALTRHLVDLAARVDAVDPSAAMIEEARHLPGGGDSRIRWIVASAETAPLDPPYGLITTGQSLHWMDHGIVMPRFHDALAPGGRLVATDIDWVYPPAWRDALVGIIKRYSPVKSPFVTDLFGDLVQRGLFERAGFQRTSLVPVELSIEDFVAALHSTSSLSQVTLGDRASAFADEVRALFARLQEDPVRFAVAGNVVWGRPLRG
ncbi:MAG: methyltransferase domain-containing protein [Chloroflexi bacterium]|nr:MAG: methyltransferase domain-containing protein [Chloroflexota bacterium]